jgi:Raf kinase inhibitor-like YbhB/YbcL family protein
MFEVVMAFNLTSEAFNNGDDIPVTFTADGDDISPALSWSDPPVKTASFALVLEDRNEKDRGIHWILWNIPATARSLPERVANAPTLPDGTHQGRNDFNKVGYRGPCSTRVAERKYEFTLYALNSKLELEEGSGHAELMAQMRSRGGLILEQTQLVGHFKPERDSARLRALESDKEYVVGSDGLKQRLAEAYKISPQDVRRFFSNFSIPSAFAAKTIATFLGGIRNETVRRSLKDYVDFAGRFSIQFRFKTNPPEFKTILQPSYGNKFHVKIVGDHLEPGKPAVVLDDESFRDFFVANDLKILNAAQELVDKGEATYTQIDDGPEYSMLKDLETFAYKDDGVAFFVHNAEGQQPRLGCIFGEKFTKQLLHDMGKTVTEFQRKYFSRGSGGRPPDMDQVKKTLAIDEKKIPNKAKAFELAEGGDPKKVKAQEVRLSKLHQKKRKKNR